MSLRPPSRYVIVVTAADAGGSSDSANFVLAASGPSAVKEQLEPNLNLMGILFEAAADGKAFVSIPAQVPSGVTPSTVTQTISAPGFYAQIPASIDGATLALPFELHYGPLGPGAR